MAIKREPISEARKADLIAAWETNGPAAVTLALLSGAFSDLLGDRLGDTRDLAREWLQDRLRRDAVRAKKLERRAGWALGVSIAAAAFSLGTLINSAGTDRGWWGPASGGRASTTQSPPPPAAPPQLGAEGK